MAVVFFRSYLNGRDLKKKLFVDKFLLALRYLNVLKLCLVEHGASLTFLISIYSGKFFNKYYLLKNVIWYTVVYKQS